MILHSTRLHHQTQTQHTNKSVRTHNTDKHQPTQYYHPSRVHTPGIPTSTLEQYPGKAPSATTIPGTATD
ncbi:hypothetical protein CGMCC3_g10683 [Colletotrichum fructicola]|uniref:Uncharacterized protein n=1 Tax=Colletotrichum fructicola (strain Nara gc5) TaxID=1213859 RepID=A0A7J6JNZ0_COLFN|nr:uncharacterized protein CGMCC3_g10683 [Colletotrichum fructicola]KAE9573366.1 hypothetical protein CGMCC3_g10683 [Colletotrichum fructicola]KAF4423473.1 hypothetical protein CFRS1_v004593 [Colletotrichum fructicola]KAF4492516.1 hypothetical protein CGGC5_v000839 [Colletotrichum fructicola Nara gc5]KAF5515032.1 hypothetical protein CGCF413_v000812 [Colletotrichum fructicola]